MIVTYAQYSGPILAAFGFGLQYLRAHKALGEQYTFALAGLATLAAFGLLADWSSLPHGVAGVQEFVLQSLLWCFSSFATVLGGTFTASKAASAGLSLVPVTNSK